MFLIPLLPDLPGCSVEQVSQTEEAILITACSTTSSSRCPDWQRVSSQVHSTYTRLPKEREAEPLYQRAWQIREQHLGQHHPETAQLLYDLALLRKAQGRGNEALSLVERVCSIRSQALGDTHPQTVAAQRLLFSFFRNRQVSRTKCRVSEALKRVQMPSEMSNREEGLRLRSPLVHAPMRIPSKRSSTPAVTCIPAPGAVLPTSGRPMNAGWKSARNAIHSPEARLLRS